MNILLIDIDSKITNVALKKIEIYYKARGCNVIWNMPLAEDWADRIWVSCIFRENLDKCRYWESVDKATIGGSGYDLNIVLPPEIEAVKPKINLGFTTRGCFRRCPFCIVPKKEGRLRVVADLLDLWDFNSCEITLLDNNILGLPKHFFRICQQAYDNKILIDFNQGLDHRLLTRYIACELKHIRHREYRFAFDMPEQLESVEKAINLLARYNLKRNFWYVLVGYNTSFQEDLSRLNYLRDKRQTVFVQRYTKTKGNRLVGQWANQHNMFKAVTFKEFMGIPKYANFYKRYATEIQLYFGDWFN